MKRSLHTVMVLAVLLLIACPAVAAPKKNKEKKKDRQKLPAAAEGFAGMIQGTVVAVKGNRAVLKVAKIDKVWKHSKAKDPKSLVGVSVNVQCREENGKPSENLVRYLATLKKGDKTVLDVNHKKGRSMTLLELTQEQRKQIAKE